MNYELQAGKNFAWSAAAQLLLRIFGIVFFVYMSYKLGSVGIGQYGFVISFTLMWFIFCDFGAGNYLVREWSKGLTDLESAANNFNIVSTLRFIISIIIFVPFLIINYYINYEILLPLVLFFISTFAALFIGLVDGYLQSANLFKQTSIRQIIEKIILLFFGVVLLCFWPKLEMVFLAMIISQVASLFYSMFYVLPFKFKFQFNKCLAWNLIRKGIPFVFIIVFSSIYSRIDMVMLRFIDSFEAVGWYTVSYRFLDVASIFPAILLMPSVIPVLSRLYYSNQPKEVFIAFFNKFFRILFSFGLISALVLILFAPFLIDIFFGQEFGPSILSLRILMISAAILSVGVLFNAILLIQNKEKIGLYIIIFGASLNIILNLILIPKYSLYGAAWATVVAEFVNIFLLQYFSSWQKDFKYISKATALVTINIALLFLLKYFLLLNNIIAIISLLLINILILFYWKLLYKEDIIFFINPIKNKLSNIKF